MESSCIRRRSGYNVHNMKYIFGDRTGPTKISVGDLFFWHSNEQEYMLCRVGCSLYCLINPKTGDRFCDAGSQQDIIDALERNSDLIFKGKIT